MKKVIACLMAAFCLLNMTACISLKEDSGAYEAAMAALSEGDYELAMSEFKKAAEEDGRRAEGYRGQGIIYYKQGSYEAAVLMFEKSLESMKYENEGFTNDVLLYEADSYVKNHNEEEGLKIYKTLENSDRAALVYAKEGQIYLGQGDMETARKCFEFAAENDIDIKTCLMIYEAYKEVSLEGDGAAYLETAVALEPESAEDNAVLGRIYIYLEDYKSAETELNKAIEGGCSQAANILGDLYLEQNDVSGAKGLFMGSLSKGQDAAMAYNGLAMCAICEGNYESALKYVNMGLELDDEEAMQSLLFNEIVAYENMLDFDTAKEKMEKYLKMYPDDDEARREYKFISHGRS